MTESARLIGLDADRRPAPSSASALEVGPASGARCCDSPSVIFEKDCELVRFDISMDGCRPSRANGLSPLLRRKVGGIEFQTGPGWRAAVGRNRSVESANSIGRGRIRRVRRPGQFAAIHVASASRYSTALVVRSRAAIRGCSAPRVGRVSMDFVVADVGDIEGNTIGREMAVIAHQSDGASPIEEPAGPSGPISSEVPAGQPPGDPRDVV